MRLNINRDGLQIIPEDLRMPYPDERDTAFIEGVLGLKKNGDSIKLVRQNAYGLGRIAYLETQK